MVHLPPQPGGSGRRTALVLTGGGARGAYQAGALRAIAEICVSKALPFPIISGVSAGAINAAFVAMRADDFSRAAEALWELWHGLHTSDVFVTRPGALFRNGTRLLAELSFGPLVRARRSDYLLDTSPLRDLIVANRSDGAIRRHLVERRLHAVAVTATDYRSGNAVTFFDAEASVEPWTRASRIGVQTLIRPEHVLASAALPVFFPPVAIDGRYFGDGGIRLRAPLSTVIHLGATRILAIGTRHPRTEEETVTITRGPVGSETGASPTRAPTFAEIGGVLLNALLLDGLEVDVERFNRINRTLAMMPEEARARTNLRLIPLTVLRPSADLGELATELLHRVPLPLRHLLKGLGATDFVGWDLLSYLFFDQAYTTKLLRLGYDDTMAQRADVERFLCEAEPAGGEGADPRQVQSRSHSTN
jgi:NTE family protein